jgi:hypothetical protein
MINTHSAFIFGHTINITNFYFGIDEGFDEILVELNAGAYSLTGFANELGRALNEYSVIGNNYLVSLDRTARKITISADNNFSILTTSSSQFSLSAYSLAGFSGADKTGANSYTGDDASGSIYNTQYKLQKYVDFEDQQGKQSAIVNIPASGRFKEQVSYGALKIMECEFKYICDYALGKSSVIRENLNGVADARNFLLYLITGAPIEFCQDENDLSVFKKCIIEKTPDDSKGTKFKLKEDRQYRNTFSSGVLKFREIP